jgi:hypothetical protein
MIDTQQKTIDIIIPYLKELGFRNIKFYKGINSIEVVGITPLDYELRGNFRICIVHFNGRITDQITPIDLNKIVSLKEFL